nr:hypothetical protein [Ktedonobacter robiniae]
MGLRKINVFGVFWFIVIRYDVALVVVGFADQPAENAFRMRGVGDARIVASTVPGGDVVFRDGTPKAIVWLIRVCPSLNAGEQPFDARAIATNTIGGAVDGSRRQFLVPPCVRCILFEHGYQIFSTREGEYIRFRVLGILIARQPFIRFARDRRQGKIPAEAEGAVTGTRVIRERKLWTKARAAWAGGNGHSHRASASDGIGSEFLANSSDCTTAFGQRDRGWRK